MKYLFICHSHEQVSPVAAELFTDLLKRRRFSVGSIEELRKGVEKDCYVGSAGTDIWSYQNLKGTPFTKELGDIVDKIIVSDSFVTRKLLNYYDITPGKIDTLDIPAEYHSDKNLRRLRKTLKKRLPSYLPQ